MYNAYGIFGQLKPANWMNADYLWELDTDACVDVLKEASVMERSEDRLWFSFTRLTTHMEQLVQDKNKLVEFLNRVYDGVGRRKAWGSDSCLFFAPGFENLIPQQPDGYVVELSMADLVNAFDRVRSTRSIDVVYQLLDEPTFST